MNLKGKAETVILRGRVMLDEGEIKAIQGYGRYIPLSPYPVHVYDKIKSRPILGKICLKRIPGISLLLLYKGDVLLEFSSVKWVLNEDHTLYCNLVGTLLSQNFALDNSYFIYLFFRTNDCGDREH